MEGDLYWIPLSTLSMAQQDAVKANNTYQTKVLENHSPLTLYTDISFTTSCEIKKKHNEQQLLKYIILLYMIKH